MGLLLLLCSVLRSLPLGTCSLGFPWHIALSFGQSFGSCSSCCRSWRPNWCALGWIAGGIPSPLMPPSPLRSPLNPLMPEFCCACATFTLCRLQSPLVAVRPSPSPSWLHILFAHLFAFFLTPKSSLVSLRFGSAQFRSDPFGAPCLFCLPKPMPMQFNCLLSERFPSWPSSFVCLFFQFFCCCFCCCCCCNWGVFSCSPPTDAASFNSSFSLHFYEVFVWVV